MRRLALAVTVLALSAMAALAQAADPAAARPRWAQGVPFWAALNPGAPEKPSDLEKRTMSAFDRVAADGRDHFYVYSFSRDAVDKYARDGRLLEQFAVPAAEDGTSRPQMTNSFWTDEKGSRFALADGSVVHVFSPKESIKQVTLPFTVSSVVLESDSVLAAKFPVRATRTEGRIAYEPDWLVARYELRNDRSEALLNGEPLDAPDFVSAAIAQAVLLAPTDDGGFWVADRTRYRLRSFQRNGEPRLAYENRGTDQRVSFEDGPRAGAKGEGMSLRMVHAPYRIIDIRAANGLVFILLDAGAVMETQAVDVLDAATATLVARYSLESPQKFAQMLVTPSHFVLFPWQNGRPVMMERFPDDMMVAAAMRAQRGRGK